MLRCVVAPPVAMTYPNSESDSETTSMALLALKRFVRSTLRQVGIGLVSLMVILNLGTHGPERSPSSAPELTPAQAPAQVLSHSVSLRNTHLLVSTESLTPLASPLTEDRIADRSEGLMARRMRRGITYHHLTGARLSLPTASEQAIVSVAKAG